MTTKRLSHRPETKPGALSFAPLDDSTWNDLERLFGSRGACGGCWCMLFRSTAREFEARKGEGNRLALEAVARSGRPAGILAYRDAEPVGWCAIAPRSDYPRLARSRILGQVDDTPVWSITCFFVERGQRRTGISVKLLEAACAYAASIGARVVEGYPTEPHTGDAPDVFVHTGLASAFRAAGFREVARRSETRPIMRRAVGG